MTASRYLIERNGQRQVEYSTSVPVDSIAEVPKNISREDEKFIIANLVYNPLTDQNEWVLEVDEVAKGNTLHVQAVEKKLTDDFNKLYLDATEKAQNTLFATSSESAIANMFELLLMRDDPAYFSSQGLKSETELWASDLITKLFNKGDALDTDQKVLDYANRLIDLSKDYAVYRHKKKDAFRELKESLGG